MLAAMSIVCRATPVQFPFADEKAENDSQDTNEVGPEESWELYNQITKSNGAMDEEKTNRLMHEIEEFTRLIHTPSSDSIADEEPESVTSEYQADPESETEHDYASSDWFASTWRTQLNRRNENEMWQRSSKRDDDNAGDEKENMSNIEEIIKKLRNDMKKLYNKIKEVVKMVKTWYDIWSVAKTIIVASSG